MTSHLPFDSEEIEEIEKMAEILEITVDYYLAEFYYKLY